jgi:RimJ/RimL family protein N-acetyltransferase
MPVDLQPHLIGDLVELRPLRPDDWKELFDVASDPLIWEQHPERDRYKEEVFRAYFNDALKEVNRSDNTRECCDDACGCGPSSETNAGRGGAFAIIDRATGRIIGSTRYHGFDPKTSEVEIGWTFLARSHWGGRYNHEMKKMMLDHAFTFVDRVIFLVGVDNIRSQKAMEKIGGVRAGIVEKTEFGGAVSRSVRFIIECPVTSQSRA